MSIVCLDVGSHYIGVAASDPHHAIAFSIGAVKRYEDNREFDAVKKLLSDRPIEKIIVGIPFDKKGNETPQTQAIRAYAEKLSTHIAGTKAIDVEFFDERFSTRCAHRFLDDAAIDRRARRDVIDKLSAQVILQDYLDSRAASHS